MRLLLDTHVLLWWLAGAAELTAEHRKLIADSRNTCYVSAVTVWEIGIKVGLGKLEVPAEYLEVARSQGFVELPISWNHARAVQGLPDHHRDPFDRLLVAQCAEEGLTLLSVDENVRKYGVGVV